MSLRFVEGAPIKLSFISMTVSEYVDSSFVSVLGLLRVKKEYTFWRV